MQATTMGGTAACWLSMIHSSVTPNCWLATQLDMDRLVVETAWDNLNTASQHISKHETGGVVDDTCFVFCHILALGSVLAGR